MTYSNEQYDEWYEENQKADNEWIEQMLQYYENKQESGVPLMCL